MIGRRRAGKDESGSGNESEAISLDEFMEKWLPGMMRDELNVAVFAVLRDGVIVNGAIVGPMKAKEDLEGECEQYE